MTPASEAAACGVSATQRCPVVVQISTGAASPRAHTSAWDSVGTSAPSSAIHSASHTATGRRNAFIIWLGEACIVNAGAMCVSDLP